MAGHSALIVVDIQNDFLPGGALGVPGGDQVIPVLNRYLDRFQTAALPVYASRDWHPPVTRHFKAYGGLWPPHCVQGSFGAQFHSDLRLPATARIVSKGSDPERDAYSAFDAVDDDGIGLAELLRAEGVDRLYIGGLATDYCVKWTAIEAARLGFSLAVLIDGSLGVNLQPHDSELAIAEMVRGGAELVTIERLSIEA